MRATRANQIVSNISDLQRELDKIQKRCSHVNQRIKFDYTDKVYMWHCNDCEGSVRYPTTDELDKFMHS